MKLATRYILIISALLVVIAVSALWYGNYSRRQQALREAKSKALIIVNHNLAIHTYFSHQLKPKVFEVTDKLVPHGYFEPVWMSSTYAVRGIEDYFKNLSEVDYYYKECAINARTPLNEARDYEADFIKEINVNPKLNVFSGVKTIDGKKYYVVMRRGEAMEESCLRCHSTPQAAPAGMIEKYGSQRSFNRYEGEVVSAISIRIPLDEAYAQADQITYKLALLIGVFLVVVVGVIVLLTRRMFGKPLQTIKDQADMIAQDEENLGGQLPLNFPGEWNDLARDFNSMSANLRDTYDNLDFLVQKRTEELEQALAEVKQLGGLLPICAHCKKIRDDKGYWKQIEEFISKHSEAQFSHGVCPDCMKKHYPELFSSAAKPGGFDDKNKME